jgi:thiosulfate dehydrogenase (quinone) large subunit
MIDRLKNKSFIAWVLLIIRLYVGWIWLSAGYEKIINPKWVGSEAGTAVSGFLKGALAKTSGDHPDVMPWYAWLISHIALPNAVLFSYLVSFGELLVGIALILGAFTVLAASAGLLMNFSYLFAGAVSINPLLILLEWILIWGNEKSGQIGLDRFIRKYWMTRKEDTAQ